jgi:hypothetical protein
MRFLRFMVVLVCAVSSFATVVRAEDPKEVAPWSESCRHYRSARHFVNQSTLYCFHQRDHKACQARAESYFERCGFTGDFQKMSARIGARMLLVLALTSVRSVHHIDL